MTLEIPTPTLAITDIGTLAIAPKLLSRYQSVFRAVKMGMNLDDFRDFEVVPRPLNANNYPNLSEQQKYPKYRKFEKSLNDLRKNLTERERSNTGWFIAKINYLEGMAVSVDCPEWSLDKIKEYREKVAFVWAVYLSSFAKNSSLKINDEILNDGLDLNECKTWVDKYDAKHILEKNYTKRLFYSALVFQVVSDIGKKDYASEKSIPGFHLHKDKNDLDNILKDYYDRAIESGCNPLFLNIYRLSFNRIQSIFSKVTNSDSKKEWLYS